MIKDTGEFVINFPDTSMRDKITLTGELTANDPSVDKFKAAGLTPGRSLVVKAPTIEECPISIECVVTEDLSLGSHHLFVGEIVAYHAAGGHRASREPGGMDEFLYEAAADRPRTLMSWCSLVQLRKADTEP